MVENTPKVKVTGLQVAMALAGLISIPVAMYGIFGAFENLDASHVMIIQHPISGELTCFTDPGLKTQGFGDVTKYPRRGQYSFDKKETSKHIQFNDGGTGDVLGSIQWEMPLACPDMIRLHKAYGSPEAIQNGIISKSIDSAIYLAGPTMTSIESTAERKGDLVHYIHDQTENGIYVTRAIKKKIVDPVTNVEREVNAAEIVIDANGLPKRQQGSMVHDFNVHLMPLNVAKIDYEKPVMDQIAKRQEATNQVQIAVANATRAEQDNRTAAATGQAKATEEEWKQRAIAAQKVAEAQQKLDVATLSAREAEQYKREQILRGEGDAARKQLVMNADGALDAKIGAYIMVNKNYADAIQSAQPGAWSPVVMMGGSGQTGASNATALVDLLTAKTARELGMDLSVQGKAATVKGTK